MKGRTKVSHLEQPALSVKRPGHASQRRNWGGICRLRNPTWSLPLDKLEEFSATHSAHTLRNFKSIEIGRYFGQRGEISWFEIV